MAISHFARISLHCYRIAAIVLHRVSAEPGAAGAAIARLYPVSEAPGRHSFLKINFLNLVKL